MKRVLSVCIACLVCVGAPTTAAPEEDVRVMTRNLYLGADLAPVLNAATPLAFLQAVLGALGQIAATDFPERAGALAQEIADKRPHLVGLQEVYRLSLNGSTAAPPYRDYLDDLLEALAARGAQYYVVAANRNLDVAIPIPGVGVVQTTDRDVVLARADVTAWPVAIDGCRESVDGCNFDAVFTINSPVGPIALERGYVVVDALIGARTVRFVNTHFEVPELPLQVQAAQAAELLAALAATPNPHGQPVIVAGDLNSAPTDVTQLIGGVRVVPPYRQLANSGLSDVWLQRPGSANGLTCCELSDLSNAESAHVKRVDVIFTSVVPDNVKATLLGVDAEDKTVSGLWPSDHAGVVASLRFRP